MNEQLDLLQGALDMLILKAVSLGPQHGYGVLLRMSRSPAINWRYSRGRSTRQHRLEHQGAITSEWGESRTTAVRSSIGWRPRDERSCAARPEWRPG